MSEPEIIPPIRYKRKKLQLDDDTLGRISALGQLQCTQKEAAGALGVAASTFEAFIQEHPEAKEAWFQGKQNGKVKLRHILWDMAKNNPQVAMFLAKDDRWLKMAEKKLADIQDNRVLVFTDEQNRARILELVQLARGKGAKEIPE